MERRSSKIARLRGALSNAKCWVELGPCGCWPIRIFRNRVDAVTSDAYDKNIVSQWARKDATEAIRRQVFARADGHCDRCGKAITSGQMHMHERVFRSHGGEVSLENCWALCKKCHTGEKYSEHPGVLWSEKVKHA